MGDVVCKAGRAREPGSVEVRVEADAAHVAVVASDLLARTLRETVATHGNASIALSGGTSPLETYALLARAPGVDWTRVRVFWVDERAVPPDHTRSNYRWAKASLLDAVPIPADHVHRMPGEQGDLSAAARSYEATLRAHLPLDADGLPRLDAMVLGMGDDGHTASLFPGEKTVEITDCWVADVPARGDREARLTLTAPVIQAASRAIVIVLGAAKHAPLLRAWAVQGDVRQTPIRVVRACHGVATWIADTAAVGQAKLE
jgi:6-phosphogluconolactonase